MIIKILLLLNQYHGNAWHHAHCEGLIDWPPAPMRILRAIVAGSYNTKFSTSQQVILKQILWKMSQVLPTYYLPPTAYLQWRSPRPQVQKDVSIAPGKILYSACLLVPENDSAIYCNYDIDCSDEELKTLQQALNGITYLGRRESPAVWELVEEMPTANAYPDSSGLRVVASLNSSLTEDELWDSLNLSAADVFQHRKQAVFPGVEQTTYKLEPSQFRSESDRLRTLPRQVLLSVQGTNKVSVSQSIALCEALHRRLAKSYPEPIFTGMDTGVKIGSHDHAFITPVTERTGRWIEYIRLYALQGFSPSAINAIANIDKVRIDQWVSLALVDFSHSSEQHSYWESITPMFLSRYPVTRDGRPRMIPGTSYQKDCAEHQALKYLKFLPHLELNGELSFEEFPKGLGMRIDGELIAVCKCEVWVDAARMLNGKHGKLALEKGFRIWIEFTRPVSAPISLGYRCHYGFGSLISVRGWVGVEGLIPQKAYVSRSVG
ncbi:type I-U CRISPR-associated protein Csb2 [Trichocoleus sp. DQ-A3]|uniref:type I-G CRISPR-associated protein Csb2 n=1 Tax=Cyanophyceae TaxID=3028117 RepID=UPI001688E4B2|nr:type I-U CRISPR-associated protein Csb2 [Coleofasciculus sp. FACHB-125]MBD1903721.1 type I-U CRISPR-associated protein Cas5/Cas6 [Coleofasciculus sp. FACHB-125]